MTTQHAIEEDVIAALFDADRILPFVRATWTR